jgi:hypothetical protein
LAALLPGLSRGDSPRAGAARAALARVIQREQRSAVRESWGELAGECFTEIDYDDFVRGHVAERIARGLQQDAGFRAAVAALRGVSSDEQSDVLEAVRQPLRPTWAQQGRITRSGTTVAGQRAELAVAEAIVNMVKQLLRPGAAGAPPKH